MARAPRPPPVEYKFAFLGFRDGWYLLRADMTIQGRQLDALAFEGRVLDWLVNQRITPGKWSHLGSGNTGEYPIVPNEDGTALCLLLKRPADVLRLSRVFPCIGVTDAALMAAVQAESKVHRFVVEDIAKLAHAAIHKLITTFGDKFPTWEEWGGETRVAFILQVTHRLEHPNEPVETTHQNWVDQRHRDRWRYGSHFSVANLTDPLLVPWKNLSETTKARYRLFASMVSSVAPLLAVD